jgi:hypothetical protein
MSLLPILAVVCSSFTFEAPRVLPYGGSSSPQPVVVDLDGDGRNDLVVSNRTGSAVLRYGDPNGELSGEYTIPYPVTGAGDVVGNPLPDLFTSGGVLENLGGRNFAAPQSLPSNGRNFARDFTGDGRIDLVIGTRPNRLQMLERLPDGRLEEMPATDTGTYTSTSATGDVDGDHRAEILGIDDTSVRAFRYDGAGQFAVAATHATTAKPRLVETADLDRDGTDDILVYEQIAALAQIEVFYGSGRKAFFGVGFTASEGDRLRIADLNGDGAPDLIVGHRGGGNDSLSFHLNDGHGTLRQTSQVLLTSIYELGAGDLDGDARAELLLPTALGTAIFDSFASRLLSIASPNAYHAAFDVNGDGVDEIAFYDGLRAGIRWPDGTLEKFDPINQSGAIGFRTAKGELVTQDGYRAVALAYRDGAWQKRTLTLESYGIVEAGDFDGDGVNELVAVLISGPGYSIRVYRGNDAQASFSTYVPSPTLHDHFDFILDDFNADGVPDVALSLSGTAKYPGVGGIPQRNGSITVYAGNRDGTLSRIATPVTNQSPRDLIAGDFNGDGVRDLAFNTYDNDARVVYAQAGHFTEAQTVIEGPSYHVNLAARDVDGDGITDLLGAKIDAFVLLLGSHDGLVESGRWSAGYSGALPLFARLRANEAPTLLLSTSAGAMTIEATCVQSRRRSVHH